MKRERKFKLVSDFRPAGDQPKAIEQLTKGILEGKRHQVLLGVTGSGKTFTIANVIARVGKPTLVIAHNKTLAAQLYQELKQFFPENAVEYFVSYYDYYQPEAYIPATDTYIAKESHINDEIDRLRHSATRAILERRDTIIVASVSCIFAVGSPQNYRSMMLEIEAGQELHLEELMDRLVSMQYERSVYDFMRGMFRVRGDVVEIFPSHEANRVVRLYLFGDYVEEIEEIDPLTGKVISGLESVLIPPNSHYVTPAEQLQRAIKSIKAELEHRIRELEAQGKHEYARRLEQRTKYDLELISLMGHCPGIENYSRHLDGRAPGEPPWTLLDYFPEDFLCIIDESHVTIPQLRGMYHGDRSRKETLVEYGFRLPSALDNRPLTFEEFLERVNQVIYVSATPGEWEVEQAGGVVVEQIVRPTGLVDPKIEIRPASTQVEDLLGELDKEIKQGGRVLVTTLTKRMAEDLTDFLCQAGYKAAYLHSDIDTLERIELILGLRKGKYDVLVGINLLREGLDLPEVTLVAVLDADKEGFLRSETSLIQIAGRTARNVRGRVILYADNVTESIRRAVEETERRRRIQMEYNRKHGITPKSIVKKVQPFDRPVKSLEKKGKRIEGLKAEALEAEIEELTKQMWEASRRFEFEKAAELRDLINELKALLVQG